MTQRLMRAKFVVTDVHVFESNENIRAVAVSRSSPYPEDGSDEDNTYAKFSPSGELKLTIANPALFGKIRPGAKFYMDFTVSEK